MLSKIFREGECRDPVLHDASIAVTEVRLAREVTLRYAPNLIFELDISFDQADRIAALLARPLGAVRTENHDDAG